MNMVSATEWILLLAALWALLLLGAFLMLPRFVGRPGGSVTKAQGLLIIVVVALVARMVPNFLLPMGAGYDIKSYQIVGNLVLSEKEVYTSSETTNRHPYLPLQMYWMGFALRLANATGIPFVKIVRLAPIGADVGIAILLFLCLRQSASLKDALHGGLLYALNPVSVFVSAYHGQFDAIPTLFLLLAVVRLEGSPLLAGGWLGLGILDKSWPMLALPSLYTAVRGRRRLLCFLGGMAFVPLMGLGIYCLLFGGQVGEILARALGYDWGVGVWGYTYFFRLLSVLEPGLTGPFAWLVRHGRYLTLVALGLVWLLRARKEPAAASVLTVLVAFFAMTHAFSIQYLMWVIPFAILNRDDLWLARYTLGAFAYMLLAYMTLILGMYINHLLPWPQADWFIIMPAGLPAWLVTVGWAVRRLSGEREGTSASVVRI